MKINKRLIFWLTIIAIIIPIIIFAYQEITKEDSFTFDNKNTSFYGNICQGNCQGAFPTYYFMDYSFFKDPSYEGYNYKNHLHSNVFFDNWGLKYDLFNVKTILLDGQEAFIPIFHHDENIFIGWSNEGGSKYIINEEYKIPSDLKEEDICFTIYSKKGGVGELEFGKRFYENREDCYLKVAGEKDVFNIEDPMNFWVMQDFFGNEMAYNLYNVKMTLPIGVEVFLPEYLHKQNYSVIWVAESDFSEIYIPPYYQPPENEGDVCFLINATNSKSIIIEKGLKFKLNSTSCYEQIYGDYDVFKHKNPKTLEEWETITINFNN